jgi:hypothetical protein
MLKELANLICTRAGFTLGTNAEFGHRKQESADRCILIAFNGGKAGLAVLETRATAPLPQPDPARIASPSRSDSIGFGPLGVAISVCGGTHWSPSPTTHRFLCSAASWVTS